MNVGLAARFRRAPRVGRSAISSTWRGVSLATCIVLSALSACGGGDTEPGADSGDSCTGQGENYRVGMSKTSAAASFTVDLIDANPAPPAIGTNAWMIRIKDASGSGVMGATVNINLDMPKHMHPQPGTGRCRATASRWPSAPRKSCNRTPCPSSRSKSL